MRKTTHGPAGNSLRVSSCSSNSRDPRGARPADRIPCSGHVAITGKPMVVSVQALREFTVQAFRAIGCPDADAALAAEVLLSADLTGVDSHGVARLSGYVRLWEGGRLNPTPKMRIVHETPTTATVDGDGGLGLVTAPFAMDVAIEKARRYGSGWVAVRNSNHFGIAGYHALKAVREDMIGFAVTNASPLVAPTFSSERLLGTNPICYA